MSEHEPIEPQETKITFNLGKHTFEFDPVNDNPKVFKMGDEPHYNDYFVFVSNWVNGEPAQGFIFFRELFDFHNIDFDELVEYFKDEGVPILKQDEPDEQDTVVYEAWANGNPTLPLRLSFVGEPDESGGETAGTEEVPSKEVVHIPTPEAPELIEYGPTKEKSIQSHAEFIAYLIETNRGHLL